MNKHQQIITVFLGLLVSVFVVGVYQQAYAGDFCGVDGCYNYPHEKAPSSLTFLSNNFGPTSAAPVTGF